MNTAVALKPIAETLPATVAQLDALANTIAEIDSYKNFEPSRLPVFIKEGKAAVATILNRPEVEDKFNPDWASSKLFSIASPELEINTGHLDDYSCCLKCIEEIVISDQLDLLQPLIETGHDLVTLMAGDKAHLIYSPEAE